ncbi:hypothetical protein Sme01_15420 [Sphaerisporangium melleum]|uniref:Uncharacterized protein n=1 Tax=Sphaerisporangium melleum TaxID=321316 RepID=A0A917VT00_9ACTN|nr:hypothetical protein [Sphaerisporangium melleum]GGL11123.1 hypothetical protein GCM10007964_61630 [Sphaerisporangium melleum]GII69066.1 hypothetical protein Sme01_15420 [Sphaerisporangium melleum]
MSVELGVWYARTPLTPEEATRKYLAGRAAPAAAEATSGTAGQAPAEAESHHAGDIDGQWPAQQPLPQAEGEPLAEAEAEASAPAGGEQVPEGDMQAIFDLLVEEGVVERHAQHGVRPVAQDPPMERVTPLAEVAAFYDALTGEFPDLTEGGYASSPWATPLTVGEEFLVMSIVFPRAAEVCRTVLHLAADRGFVCFDPCPDDLFFAGPEDLLLRGITLS